MNVAQQSLYFREWGKARKSLAELGRPHDDAARKALQKAALGGVVKSSKFLTNAELTKVLAKFRSHSEPGNFNAQMHAEEDPEIQRHDLLAKIESLAAACDIDGGLDGVTGYFKKFLCQMPVRAVDYNTLRKLAGILERRKAQLAPAPAAEDDGDPF